jgi:hypothetical protein
MSRKQPITVADVEGPWVDCGFESGLIQRCKQGWNIPIVELSNEILATYLRQRIALSLVVPEARKRVALAWDDSTGCIRVSWPKR